MTEDLKESPYQNGYWGWDEVNNGLIFIKRGSRPSGQPTTFGQHATQAAKSGLNNIKFKDTIDNVGQAQFRRFYQRKIKPTEPKVITIQDIKDVAIYTVANPRDLSPEFISYLHTEKMDVFLRTLIVYFQYYFKVWDHLMAKREEARRKLRQPLVTITENVIRDDLADFRSMVARNYGYIILGLEDVQKFYHMRGGNNVSLSDKDRHLFECLMCVVVRIIWIALQRKYFTLIEIEVNRMLRTKIFNTKGRVVTTFNTLPEEDRVLEGAACTVERKLKHRSPAVQELIFDDHNYRMLAIGEVDVDPSEERLAYLEIVYTIPEEFLYDLNIGIGILGLPRSWFDGILMVAESAHKKFHIPDFKLPPRKEQKDVYVEEFLPELPCKYKETEQTKKARAAQCKSWRNFVSGTGRPQGIASDAISFKTASSILSTLSDENFGEN